VISLSRNTAASYNSSCKLAAASYNSSCKL